MLTIVDFLDLKDKTRDNPINNNLNKNNLTLYNLYYLKLNHQNNKKKF